MSLLSVLIGCILRNITVNCGKDNRQSKKVFEIRQCNCALLFERECLCLKLKITQSDDYIEEGFALSDS